MWAGVLGSQPVSGKGPWVQSGLSKVRQPGLGWVYPQGNLPLPLPPC